MCIRDRGTVWVRKGYDAKGNLQSVMSYQVDEVETLPSGQEVEADYVYTNPSGTIVNKGDIKAYCQNGEFFLDSKETLSYQMCIRDRYRTACPGYKTQVIKPKY